jgi:hypothetical protein
MCATTLVAVAPGLCRLGMAATYSNWVTRSGLAREARSPNFELPGMSPPSSSPTNAVPVERLANTLVLGALLEEVRDTYGSFELLDHWTQGEFHHDLVLRLPSQVVVVVATNCNGGVKEVLSFAEPPARASLWAMRCPGNPEFDAPPAVPLARSATMHWFDPCELLLPDARSELLPEHRVRQDGGGWTSAGSAGGTCGPRRPT